MLKRNAKRFAVAVPLVAAGIIGSTMNGKTAPALLPSACAVWTEDTIPIAPAESRIVVKLSEPLGDSLTARFPEESKIDVIRIKREPGDEQMTARLTINTARAVAGQWQLTVASPQNQCVGKVWVGKI